MSSVGFFESGDQPFQQSIDSGMAHCGGAVCGYRWGKVIESLALIMPSGMLLAWILVPNVALWLPTVMAAKLSSTNLQYRRCSVRH